MCLCYEEKKEALKQSAILSSINCTIFDPIPPAENWSSIFGFGAFSEFHFVVDRPLTLRQIITPIFLTFPFDHITSFEEGINWRNCIHFHIHFFIFSSSVIF